MTKLNNHYLMGLLMLLLCSLGTMTALAENKQIAFPGAEGFGRYATGGRGGTVYHVTNLNDSGTGSLRWALSQSGKKIIVFDVSGTIHLKSELQIKENTTIAGQSAPGDGICIADCPCSIKGNNVIVRYMRFRLGNKNIDLDLAGDGRYDGWDGFGALDQNNIIIDHCSVSWSIDECLSMGGCKDITVQWCLVAQSMVKGHSKLSHGYGGNWGGSGASYHHNMMIHHNSRVPRLGPRPTTQLDERMDMRNNVFYNWGGNGCYGGEGMKVNIVNNYYKPGPATDNISARTKYRIAAPGVRTESYCKNSDGSWNAYYPALHLWGRYYVKGNVNPDYPALSASDDNQWTMGIHEQIDNASNDNTYTAEVQQEIRAREPIAFPATTTHTAAKAYEKVLQYVGASLHRDAFDLQMVNDATNRQATATGSGNSSGIVNTQDDNTALINTYGSAWPTLNSETAPADTDGDGIPDTWEDTHGLDKNNASDGSATATGSGYTNVEVYLNSLVADITAAQNANGVLSGETQEGELEEVEYTISNDTHTTAWNFNNDINITATTTLPTYSGNATTNTFLATSNTQYRINLPQGVTITSMKIYGYGNGKAAYLKELNDLNLGTNHTFGNGASNAKEYTFNDINATESIIFSIYNNTQVKITLTGIKHNEIVGDSSGNDDGGSQTGGNDQYTYIIAPSTHTEGWAFNDGISISTTKDYGENHIGTFYGIKYSRNEDFTINLPENIAINTVEVEGWSNATASDTPQYQYITKLGDNTFTESEHTFGTTLSKHTYTLAQPATGTMVFRNAGGKQLICAITLTGTAVTDIKSIQSSDQRLGDGAIYNLQGVRVQSPTQRGIYIRNGKKFVVK